VAVINRRAIVVTVDGWGAGFLGPYGNTWLETPVCNHLASAAMLLEHALVDSPTVNAFFRGVWAGEHAALPARSRLPSLAEALGTLPASSCLITDAAELAEHPDGKGFDRAELITGPRPETAAATAEQTQLARLTAAALAALEHDPADLVWIHSQGMSGPWDAPSEFRQLFPDEDDPPPPSAVEPPDGPVPVDCDPDLIQGWIWAYAGQVALLDLVLGAVWESWQQLREPALLVVMGTRGYALAEHGHWGHSGATLHSERLQVPLLVAANTLDLANIRSQQLVQPQHVFQTLLDWFGVDHPRRDPARSLLALPDRDVRIEGSLWPPLAVARCGEAWALRTPVWHACTQAPVPPAQQAVSQHGVGAATESAAWRLYLKPDDRWEVNDVADRCPEVVAELAELREKLIGLPPEARLEALLPLTPALTSRPA
jgi:hypothetical protein